MKTLFSIVLSSILLFCVAGCKQSNAEQELAQLRDSLNNAKVEQQKQYEDSIQKVQEEQRQQAIADSIANAKKMEAEKAAQQINISVGTKLKDVCKVPGVTWCAFVEAGGNYFGIYVAFKYKGETYYTNAFYSWARGEEELQNVTRYGADRLRDSSLDLGLNKVTFLSPKHFTGGAAVIDEQPWYD